MNEITLYIILMILLCLCFLLCYLYYKIRVKLGRIQVCLHLVFHDWGAALGMWHNINKQQAISQNKDVDSLFEEVLRNFCEKDRDVRLKEFNSIL